MRYEFVKTVLTPEGEVAYLLDTQRGVVVKAPVESMVAEVEKDTDYIKPPPSNVTLTPTTRLPGQPYTLEEIDQLPVPPAIVKAALDPAKLPEKPTSIVPPELRGIFRPPGTAGADTETRQA
jgi:hypothetical protein